VIVGPNGAGKSTAMKAVFGMLDLRQGSVRLDDQDITDLSPQDRVAKGMGFVPQNANIFTSMTVEENLRLGAWTRRDQKQQVEETLDRVYALFPKVKERRRQASGTMSGGEQQMVAMGRALMSGPSLILMDEPSMGLAPALVKQSFELIQQIHEEGMSMLVVEQNANMALSIADYGYVLQAGEIVLEGPADKLASDPDLKRAYLG
jgi:branched-chain amino acid transport system ATP-binding protein